MNSGGPAGYHLSFISVTQRSKEYIYSPPSGILVQCYDNP